MTSLPGLRGWSRLQARRGVLQTTTDDDDRRQRAKQYWPIRQASNKLLESSTLWHRNRKLYLRNATASFSVDERAKQSQRPSRCEISQPMSRRRRLQRVAEWERFVLIRVRGRRCVRCPRVLCDKLRVLPEASRPYLAVWSVDVQVVHSVRQRSPKLFATPVRLLPGPSSPRSSEFTGVEF